VDLSPARRQASQVDLALLTGSTTLALACTLRFFSFFLNLKKKKEEVLARLRGDWPAALRNVCDVCEKCRG
jgi:hypothetical protein